MWQIGHDWYPCSYLRGSIGTHCVGCFIMLIIRGFSVITALLFFLLNKSIVKCVWEAIHVFPSLPPVLLLLHFHLSFLPPFSFRCLRPNISTPLLEVMIISVDVIRMTIRKNDEQCLTARCTSGNACGMHVHLFYRMDLHFQIKRLALIMQRAMTGTHMASSVTS